MEAALSAGTDQPVPEGFVPARFSSSFLRDSGPYHLRTHAAGTTVGLRIRDSHVNYVEVAHGGVLATLADVCLSLQCHLLEPAGLPVTTVSLTTNFLAGAKLGDWLEAEGRIDRQGKRIAYVSGNIRRGEEVLAEVKSTWCSLDSITRRPARLARDVVSHFLPE